MRLDLERARPAITNVDDAGILSGALQHVFAARGQALQMHARRFIGAVLAPHHAEDAELREGGFASPEKLLDLLVFIRGEAVLADRLQRKSRGRRGWHGRHFYCRILVPKNDSAPNLVPPTPVLLGFLRNEIDYCWHCGPYRPWKDRAG